MRSEFEVNQAIEKYSDTIKRICVLYLKNQYDTEDIFQNVFIKYMLSSKEFENQEHEKAWFIRVTINCCKDFLKSFFRSKTVPLEELREQAAEISEESTDVLEAVLSLPKKYKEVIYLFYYEDYSAVEIADILGKNTNTVYTNLSRAKKMLKVILGGESDAE